MFSHQESLAERIDRVSARLRSIRFWWSLAIIAGLAAAGLLLLVRLQPSAAWTRRELISAVLVGVMAATLIAMLVARFSYRNRRKLALRIEQQFPSLNQRLLTALSIPQPSAGQPLGYLQQEVIREPIAIRKRMLGRKSCRPGKRSLVGCLASFRSRH